jgi:hypothetical protein
MNALPKLAAIVAVAAIGAFPASAYAQGQAADQPHAADQSPTSPAAPSGQTAPAPKRATAPANAYVYIGWPNDGEVIRSNRFKVWFGTRDFGVAPAGTTKPNTGHHHLLIDAPLPKMDEPIPSDKNHLHFGLGQTETIIELPSGTHTLQLLMGDTDHVPHDPPVMSRKITVYVRAGEVSMMQAR